MSEVGTTAITAANELTVFEKHYAELLPEFQALRSDELVQVNLDITSMVATILGAYPEIVAQAGEIEREAPTFDVAKIKRLDEYAMALSHAHTLYAIASRPPTHIEALVEEGTRLRELLLSDATALAARDLVRSSGIDNLAGPIGYKNVAADLQVLAALLREHFGQIQGKCAIERAELNRADELAAEILRAVGEKEQGPGLIAETAEVRSRAFTVVTELYDQIRRVLRYLRWNEDDADTIAPSLYTGRNARKLPSTDLPKPPAPTAPVTGTPRAESTLPHPPAAAVTVSSDPFLS